MRQFLCGKKGLDVKRNKYRQTLSDKTPRRSDWKGAAFRYKCSGVYTKKPSKTPAATADPITPATFGPIACISK